MSVTVATYVYIVSDFQVSLRKLSANVRLCASKQSMVCSCIYLATYVVH